MSRRIEYLDSLRGLASTQVLAGHCFVIFPIFAFAISGKPVSNPVVWALTYTPLHLFWNGGQAVVFFFVLSGFVLALPYFDRRATLYSSYLIRRFFRIYVPYIIVVTISALLLLLSLAGHPAPGIGGDFISMWSHPVSFNEYLNLVFMLGDPVNVDGPAWSLAYEMRISIIFPIICVIVGRLKLWSGLSLGIFITLFSLLIKNRFPELTRHQYQYIHQVSGNFYYLMFFVFGCALAKYRNWVQEILGKLETWQKIILILVALNLYNWDWESRNFPFLVLNPKYSGFVSGFAPGLASILIIGSALTFEKMQKALHHKIFLWVGKVSYSLYLTHVVVLLSSIYFLPDSIPLLWKVILGACFSFPVAGLSYQFLEIPCINIGHALAKKLDSKRRLEAEKVLA
jgi:peptidoglycan/LPS O-acetylase OafA/YrhL